MAFLSGAVAFGYFTGGLFFLRFWRRTRDDLFLAFSVAFGLLGISQAVVTLANDYLEHRSVAYVFRLIAFSILILTIARKNRA